MSFTLSQKVLFKHCDMAGIVFYPRYVEMINDCVEAFFDEVLDYPFKTMHLDAGIPMVQMNIRFTAPSRLGDVLDITLHCKKIGRTSLNFKVNTRNGTQACFEVEATIVHVNKDGKPTGWPEAVRSKLERQIEGTADVA